MAMYCLRCLLLHVPTCNGQLCLLLLLLLQVILTVRDPVSWYASVQETVWAICRVRQQTEILFSVTTLLLVHSEGFRLVFLLSSGR
jgi:hypothetical protein